MPGIGWECASGVHIQCKEVGCRCRCHYTAAELTQDRVSTPSEMLPTPPNEAQVTATMGLYCPKCGTQARAGDKFCRKDGARLDMPHCTQCSAKLDSGDQFCANCGATVSIEHSLALSPSL